MQPEPTGRQQGSAATQFKPGQSGNPAGRPKGSRNKLGEAFIEALYDDFLLEGKGAIENARVTDPMGYVKVCASILPKELNVRKESELSDEELDARIREFVDIIGSELGLEIRSAQRAGDPAEGTSEAVRH